MFFNFLARRFAQALVNTPPFQSIQQKLNTLMADQDTLNTEVQTLNDAFDGFAAELEGQVASLKAQVAALPTPAPLDFSGLDSLLAKVRTKTAADASTPAS